LFNYFIIDIVGYLDDQSYDKSIQSYRTHL
jgi:hypothetical protein